MDDLKLYVNQLFRHYGQNSEMNELKEEILSNLAAKKEDLIASGIDETTALKIAKESITNIDNLIEGNIKVYKYQLKLELLQNILIYSMIAWILLIPCSIFRSSIILNVLIVWVILITGMIYLIERSNNNAKSWSSSGYINLSKLKRLSKYGWVIWIIFVGLSIIKTTGLHFASDIWFHRSIVIDGPFQFVSLIIEYMVPFVTIIIPLLLQRLAKLVIKYEVNNYDR